MIKILFEKHEVSENLLQKDYEECLITLQENNVNNLFMDIYIEKDIRFIQNFLYKINTPLFYEFDIQYHFSNSSKKNVWYIIPHVYHQVDVNASSEEEYQDSIDYGESIAYSQYIYHETDISNIIKTVNTGYLKCKSFFNFNGLNHISESFTWRIFD